MFRTCWIRINLRHVPEERRPPQEPLEIDYDLGRHRLAWPVAGRRVPSSL